MNSSSRKVPSLNRQNIICNYQLERNAPADFSKYNSRFSNFATVFKFFKIVLGVFAKMWTKILHFSDNSKTRLASNRKINQQEILSSFIEWI